MVNIAGPENRDVITIEGCVFEGLGNKSPFIGSMSVIQSRKCGYLKIMPALLNYLLKTLKGRFKKVAKQSIFSSPSLV